MKQTKAIDWSEVHNRLEKSMLAIKQAFEPTLQEKKKILKDRAKRIAREPDKKKSAGEEIEVVEFLLSKEKYAIESKYIREIYPLKEFTPLPGTPSFILGIMNVRGRILSIIDIKKFFDLPEKGLTDLNKVIIVYTNKPLHNNIKGMEFGILTDVIFGVKSIPLKKIQPSLATLSGIRKKYLKGVTRERLIILDLVKILSDKSIIVEEE